MNLQPKFLKSKYLFFHLFLLTTLIIIDQFSKYLSLQFLTTSSKIQVLGFSLSEPVKNYNLIFGLDFSLSPLLILTYLPALFCLCLFYYVLSLVFIPKTFYFLQSGITVLFAGFTGNFLNKVFLSYTIDFIKWSPAEHFKLYFNLSDIFQTLAFIIIFLQIILLRKTLWRAKEKRKQFLIVKNYQIQFISYCILAFLCFSFFFLLLNYQFLEWIAQTSFPNIYKVRISFLKYSIFILFLLCLFMTIFFTYLSNKIYGPVYAFERYMRSLLKGEQNKDFKLRNNDHLKQLEKLAEDIKTGLEQAKNRNPKK